MRVIPLLALAACLPPAPPDDLEAALTHRVGCADVFVYGYDDDSTLLLTIRAADLIGQSSDPSTTFTFELPDPDAIVTLTEGTNVADAACDDVLEGGTVVRHVSDAVAGTLVITVTPNGGTELGPTAAVSLDDAVFAEDGDERATLTGFVIDSVGVGWLPG